MNRLRKYIFALTLAMLPMCGWGGLRLQQGNFVIVNQAGDARPLLRAINALQQDVEKVMGFQPALADEQATRYVHLLIANDAVGTPTGIKPLGGEEDPYVRTTFYDEMSDLLAKGYIRPPKVYPEPYYDMNNKIDRGLIPDLNRVGRTGGTRPQP